MTKTSFVGKKKALKPSVLQKKEPLRHFCRKKEPKPAGSSLPCGRSDSTPTIEKGSSRLKVRTKERKILVGHSRVAFFLCVKSSLLVKPLTETTVHFPLFMFMCIKLIQMKRFARRIVLKHAHKVTRKCPIPVSVSLGTPEASSG